MYGLMFEIIEEWAIEKHGLDVWHIIKEKAGCQVKDQEFLRRSYYNDEEYSSIIIAISESLGEPLSDTLETLGHYVIRHHFRNGYDDLMNCLGSTLRQWLSNLNAMHDHVQMTFPGEEFQAPIYWCEDCDEVEGSIKLHYYSLRGTFFVPMMVGIVKEVASFHFDLEINMEQLCLQDENGSPFSSWRITAVDKKNQWKLSPKCTGTGMECEEEKPVDFSKIRMPGKCPYSGKHLKKSKSEESLLNKTVYSDSINLAENSSTQEPQQVGQAIQKCEVGLTTKELREVFPFHVLVNNNFSIIQVGMSLPDLLDRTLSEFSGKHIQEFLEISRPVLGSAWSWKALQKLADQHFFMVPKSNTKSTLHKRVSMEDTTIRFKASMINMSEGRVMFVLAPDARNVVDLNSMGLTMSDLPLVSCQRDSIYLGEHIHQEVGRAHALDKLSKKLSNERNLSNTLLYNILPKHVADELRSGKMVEPMYHEKITLFYSDIEGFTSICDQVDAWDVIDMLNQLYSVMDFLAAHFKLYKLETIGDAYLCCAGLEPDDYHAERVANFALAVVECVKQIKDPFGVPLHLRIGIHTGSCTSGVVGTLTPRYCLFGDFVNTTARHESTGAPGRIHCSSACFSRLKHFSMFGDTEQYNFTPRGLVGMKGKGESYTYWLDSASDQNKAANNEALAGLTGKVSNLLASKNFKIRKYFRRNGDLRDETASLTGGSSGSSMTRRSSSLSESSETSEDDNLVKELVALCRLGHKAPVVNPSAVAVAPAKEPCEDLTNNEESNAFLDFNEALPMTKNWAKLTPSDTISQRDLRQKVTDIMIDAISECIASDPSKRNIVAQQLSTFITKIASQYNNMNRYHNFQRACHVLLSADFLWQKIRSDGIIPGLGHDSWDRFILLLASLILHVQHEGVSNSQLKTEKHLIYQMYAKRGSSYQERYSLQHSLSILEDECPDLYDEISFGAPRFCNSVTRLVLATDMDCMEERLGSVKERLSNPCMSDRSQVQKNVAAMELVMMVANVGHYSQDSFMHWTQAQFSEQMDAFSSKRGLDPRLSWCSSQVEVMKTVVIPLIVEFESLVPRSSCDLMGVANRNLSLWEEQGLELMKNTQVLVSACSEKQKHAPVAQSHGSVVISDPLLFLLRALIDIRKMQSLFSTKLSSMSVTETHDNVEDARKRLKIMEELKSITRVVDRFESRMELGVESLIGIAYEGKEGDRNKNKDPRVTSAVIARSDALEVMKKKAEFKLFRSCNHCSANAIEGGRSPLFKEAQVHMNNLSLAHVTLNTALADHSTLLQ